MSLQDQMFEKQLSGDEDATLGRTDHRGTSGYQGKTYKTPPGISNLREWGEERILSGKMAGKSFKKIFEEHPDYVNQMRNRAKLSPLFQSFQYYIHAREKYEVRYHQEMMTQPQPMAKSTPEKKKGVAKGEVKNRNQMTASGSWEVVTTSDNQEENKGSSTTKRNSSKMTEQTPASRPMATGDQHQVQQLQTQIAILQRELARATQGEDA